MPDAATNTELVGVMPFALRTDVRGMHVHLDRVAGIPVGDLKTEEVLAEMARQRLFVDDTIVTTIAKTVDAWRNHAGDTTNRVLISEGRPPIHGKPGQLAWSPQCDPNRTPAEAREDDSFSHYATHLVSVKAGDVIARIEPPLQGAPGIDVFGNPVQARSGRPAKFRLAGGCHVDETMAAIIADVNGTLHVEHEEISVSQGLHIAGNVDFNTGHVDSPGDIHIDGYVADLFNVTSGGNIIIGDDVNAADIRAAGDITIGATLASREKGICIASGDITIKAVELSLAVARGNLHVAREAINAQLFAGQAFDSPRANVSGGMLAARSGVTVKTLGSAGQAATLVLAGVDWMFDQVAGPLLKKIEKLDEDLEKRLPALNTLKASLKRLTHAQREQVVELEFDYHTRKDERDAHAARVETLRTESAELCRPEVQVFNTLYPGVELRLGNRVTRIDKEYAGPLKVMLADVGKARQIVLQTAAGRTIGLKTGKVDPLFRVTLPEIPADPTHSPPAE